MHNPNKFLIALLLGFAAAGFVTYASAEGTTTISPERVAAIVKCTKQAHTRYPDESPEHHRGRYLAFEECMVAAGQRP